MRFVFRADASLEIGTGHVMRCLTLANELKRNGHVCWFVCRKHVGHLGDQITNEGHNLILLPPLHFFPSLDKDETSKKYEFWLGASWQDDARQTIEVISPLDIDWLIVDHYALDSKWEHFMSIAVDNIMVIDDLANRSHECALLLDQNLGRIASDYDGLLPAKCQLLIGPNFSLIRPEFASLREQSLERRKHSEVRRILISLGGVDCNNLTGQVLNVLASSTIMGKPELDIVMGGTAPYLDEIREQASRLPFKTTVSVNVKNMAKRMSMADLSIGAAGTTSWERCCLGLPSIIVVMAENQISSAEALETAGVAIKISDIKTLGKKLAIVLLGQSNTSQLRKMSKAAAKITDGNGIYKVTHTLNILAE